ncbi:homocysteine S-methyltransferase family protein [Psychrobacter sp. SWN149]|uniref:homocysteine S-methyltransferase family protein n=1 Tax=Psychrobacter sp. SWN149 TaxID=2792057 RepID=UPI0018CDC833|nr:homocysteine S-methyltransferase family protein [Psychrobacter sp. SWN149]MBH0006640.1 homocysteine S-methyltransferase family protein [Psychrobacter sp. SWN149]
MPIKTTTIIDGGMGRELAKRGAPFRQPEWSALAMIEAPEIVRDVHRVYIQSGADVITTNSYALVPFHIGVERFADQAQALAASAGEMARAAVTLEGTATKVAGSIPPLFGSYRADLFDAEHLEDIGTPLIKGLSPHVDFWLAETQSLIAESVAVRELLSTLDMDDKPLWVAFTLEDNMDIDVPRLRSGETVQEAVATMADLNIEAILFNCCQPEVINQALEVAQNVLQEKDAAHIKLGAYANAFPPQPKDAAANDTLNEVRDDLTPPAYLTWAQKWQAQGASLIGGCCGIGPEHIQALSQHFAGDATTQK